MSSKKAHEQSTQLACEAAGSIRTVAFLTCEGDCLCLYSKSLEEPLPVLNRTAFWSNLFFAITQPMAFFIIALIFWYGSRLIANLEFGTFQFFVALQCTIFGVIQAGNMFSFMPDMSSAKGATSDIVQLLDSIPTVDAESTEGSRPANVEGCICFENIHFRSPTHPGARVLRDLSNLTVEPGTYVSLVNASSCGKSTTIQLTERFYDPIVGTVYLDKQPIHEFNVAEYRKHIALVSQEPTLYASTVRFNILLRATKPTLQTHSAALTRVQHMPDADIAVHSHGSARPRMDTHCTVPAHSAPPLFEHKP